MQRIQLGNDVFEGENSAYLLGHDTDGPTTLVDTGIDTPDTEAMLREKLGEFGVSFADVDRILLTHHHGDHSGLAAEIQAESDAEVYINAADAEMLVDPDAEESYQALLREYFDEWGMPADKREELLGYMNQTGETGPSVTVTELADGERFEAGDRELEAVHLPGHTAGQTAFYDPETGDLFAGDAVLPVYTPNVGGADVRVDDAVAKYADSLVRVNDLDPQRILPGHRDLIDDPAGRAREILEHHRERTRRVVGVLREIGPADAWAVSAELFGDLESIHILHGPGEAAAHLEHLVAAGAVERDGSVYELVGDEVDVEGLFPDAS